MPIEPVSYWRSSQDDPYGKLPSSMEAPTVRLGRVIKRFREELGMSQESLASHSGLNRTFIGEIERGETNPSFETLVTLSHTLQVSLAELMAAYEHLGS